MSLSSKHENHPGRPADTRAPSPNDQRVFRAAIFASVLIVLLVGAFVAYRMIFNTVRPASGPRFDLASLFISGDQKSFETGPDLGNPSIVVQRHIDLLRLKDYAAAYEDLSSPLRDMTPPEVFAQNAQKNEPLLRDVSAYACGGYTVRGNRATLTGRTRYGTGGASRVTAALSKEGGQWKIVTLTLVYE
jgi:hypothetical protein